MPPPPVLALSPGLPFSFPSGVLWDPAPECGWPWPDAFQKVAATRLFVRGTVGGGGTQKLNCISSFPQIGQLLSWT